LLVIRLGSGNRLVNSRPCHDCVDMMKNVGIHRIYYSIDNKIVYEKVSNMISINSSSVNRHINRTIYNAPIDNNEYYKKLFIHNIPKKIRRYNLNCFLKYNFTQVLPDFSWKIKKNKITFYDNFDVKLVTLIII